MCPIQEFVPQLALISSMSDGAYAELHQLTKMILQRAYMASLGAISAPYFAVYFIQSMKKPLLLLSILLSTAFTAQAQVALASALMSAFRLGQMATQRDAADKTVLKSTYHGRKFPMQRTPADQLSGPVVDQIALLETQLENCHTALLADSLGPICSAERQNTIKITQAILSDSRPTWNQKYYSQEVAFYLAEDGRRRRLRAKLAPTPTK
jgi:hypothetical protein